MWPLSSDECYVSIDIEADGPVPGLYSMLSLGAAVFDSDGALADTFSANLEQLPEAREDPRTMRWWAAHSAAWNTCRVDPRDPQEAMRAFHSWVKVQEKTCGTPVMVAFPAAYDSMWVQWYLHRFVGENPFLRRAIDIKTLAMVVMGAGYCAATKARMPGHWRPPGGHSHVAVEDAIEQGELFLNIVLELNGQRGDIDVAVPRKDERRRRKAQDWARQRGE